MKKVQLFLTDDNKLVIKDSQGVLRYISIFNGGGYYTDFMIQTKEQIEEDRIARKKADDEWMESMKEKRVNTNKWYEFWK